jgi:hypothetical protein
MNTQKGEYSTEEQQNNEQEKSRILSWRTRKIYSENRGILDWTSAKWLEKTSGIFWADFLAREV